MRLVAEFTTEPFQGEAAPPEHARAALAAVRQAGLDVDFGPFGTTVSGEDDVVLPALGEVLRTALGVGATRVTLQVEVDGDPPSDAAGSG